MINLKEDVAPLLQGILQDSQTLLRQEVALARSEVKTELLHARKAAVGFGVGAALAAMAGLLLTLGLVHAITWFDPSIPLWGSYLAIALGMGVAASAVLARALSDSKEVDLTPKQTIRSMKEDAKWIAHSL